jgi:hypothetical protein
MMGWIKIRPNKLLNQNFVRQGLPAKRQMVPFRFTSLNYSKRQLFDKMNKYCEEKGTGKKIEEDLSTLLSVSQSVCQSVGWSVALTNQLIQNKNNWIKRTCIVKKKRQKK